MNEKLLIQRSSKLIENEIKLEEKRTDISEYLFFRNVTPQEENVRKK
jgi:hypothetical protein